MDKNIIDLFVLFLISLPLKNLLISFPSTIIKLEIALINVSIVLNVKASAKIKIETIKKNYCLKIKLKKSQVWYYFRVN